MTQGITHQGTPQKFQLKKLSKKTFLLTTLLFPLSLAGGILSFSGKFLAGHEAYYSPPGPGTSPSLVLYMVPAMLSLLAVFITAFFAFRALKNDIKNNPASHSVFIGLHGLISL